MKLIVGLGNPGPRYEGTRHNAGFRVIDEIGRRCPCDLSQEKFHAFFGKGRIAGQEVVLLKPTTFMNLSGQSVLAAGRFYKLELQDLLVVTDDMALPTGRLRMRKQGGAGGHNGLKDIIARLGSDGFARLRVGVGPPGRGDGGGNWVGHVLSEFFEDEKQQMETAYQVAADAVECWLAEGPQAAMNRFNMKKGEA